MSDMTKHGRSAGAAEDVTDILIVEDEQDVADLLKRVIESCGEYRVRLTDAPATIEEQITRQPPDMVITDLMMPGVDGFEVIRRVRTIDPDLPVIVVSAYSTLDNAVRAVKEGAFDFLPKPFHPEAVELMLAKVARDQGLRRRVFEAQERDLDLMALQGTSPLMARLRDWVRRVRATRASVLIEGESGTGKELVARAIHGGQGPFVAINMAAIPDTLAEGELFGHRKGAFTGAVADKTGLLVEAKGGTLFLDEINAATVPMQARLLRVLQERKLRQVGGTVEIPVDFRLVCASNQSLEELVRQGGFRRDLFHRMNTLHVRIPPLREHRDDIPALVEHFLQRYARAHGRRARRFSAEAMAAFIKAEWPGNIRELENAVEQSVILCPEDITEIPLTALPPSLGGQGWLFGGGEADDDRPKTLAEIELQYILAVLHQSGDNKAEAARILDIGYKTLLRKLAQVEG